jgi:hypothetical protein
MAVHSDAVAKYGATRKRAGRINQHRSDAQVIFPPDFNQLIGHCAFSGSGRAGYADDISLAEA